MNLVDYALRYRVERSKSFAFSYLERWVNCTIYMNKKRVEYVRIDEVFCQIANMQCKSKGNNIMFVAALVANADIFTVILRVIFRFEKKKTSSIAHILDYRFILLQPISSLSSLNMRSFPFLTLLNLIICVKGSVIFPYQQNLCTAGPKSRRFGRDLKRIERSNQRRLRRASSPISSIVGSSQYGMIRNFSGLGKSGGGLLLFGAAALIKVGNIVTSESFRRALYFWVHAGPIVVHYKFTRWFLTKTKAPIESEYERSMLASFFFF